MATLKHEALSAPSPNAQAQGFDIDQYLNLDSTVVSTPSTSPSEVSKTFPVPSPSPSAGSKNMARLVPSSQQTFSRPSHQYEQYKQQTGLPVGALANTLALNDPSQYQYPSYQSTSASLDGYFGMNTVEPDLVDFNIAPEQTPSGDIEMDFGNINIDSSTFINPTAVSTSGSSSYSQSPQPGRVWPGMHQQAAMAKAQQQARQQAALAAQRQRSTSAQSPHQSPANDEEPDEMVEQSISRLLNRMRNGSVASSNNDENQQANGTVSNSRSRKEEEDMDEDERLLASEEGKKLTSKERRQLRNKVSARAFRSRRKEYIGQLEGEIAAKISEVDELQARNSELMAENTRLTDLTRLLLSSSAFSQFLNELSGTTSNASAAQNLSRTAPQSRISQQPTPHKDANPNQYNLSRSHGNQTTMQLNMAVIPEEAVLEMDPTTMQYVPSNSSSNNVFGAFDAQVYAIPSVPEAPSLDDLDFALLNDKTSSLNFPHHGEETESKERPSISPLPQRETVPLASTVSSSWDSPCLMSSSLPTSDSKFTCEETQSVGEDEDEDGNESETEMKIDESDPTWALYADEAEPCTWSVVTTEGEKEETRKDRDSTSGSVVSRKSSGHFDLVVDLPEDQAATREEESRVPLAAVERFHRLCRLTDLVAGRVQRCTARLSDSF